MDQNPSSKCCQNRPLNYDWENLANQQGPGQSNGSKKEKVLVDQRILVQGTRSVVCTHTDSTAKRSTKNLSRPTEEGEGFGQPVRIEFENRGPLTCGLFSVAQSDRH